MTPSAVGKLVALVALWRKAGDEARNKIVAVIFEGCARELEAALATAPPEQEQVSGDKEDSITRRLREAREEATLAEHKSHIEFENELYATLVDPVAEGSIKEAEMRRQLLEQARWYRQHVHDLETQLNAIYAAQPEAASGGALRERIAAKLRSCGDWSGKFRDEYYVADRVLEVFPSSDKLMCEEFIEPTPSVPEPSDGAMAAADVEKLAAELHEVYWQESIRQRDTTGLIPRHRRNYNELSEDIKDYDRALARFVLQALAAHDQKVRADTLNEAVLAFKGAYSDHSDPLIGVTFGLKAILSLASGAEEKP